MSRGMNALLGFLIAETLFLILTLIVWTLSRG